jgi:hypothetical protein
MAVAVLRTTSIKLVDHSLGTAALRLALRHFPIHLVCNVNKYLENVCTSVHCGILSVYLLCSIRFITVINEPQ